MLSCDYCSKTFKKRYDLIIHLNSSHQTCHECYAQFQDHQELLSHIDTQHTSNLKSIHKCTDCQFLSKSQVLLNLHGMKKHSKCLPCKTKFKSLKVLGQHMQENHPKWKALQLEKCDQCQHWNTRKQLQNHKRHHNKRHPCKWCDMDFATVSQQKRHLEGSRLKMATCDICGFIACSMMGIVSHKKERHQQQSNDQNDPKLYSGQWIVKLKRFCFGK